MKLSIITATYNRERHLKTLYESIIENLNNTQIEVEWIVIDDGSTDNTKKIIKNWQGEARKNFEIKYFFQENSGKMVAINKGVKEAIGEFILDCDSDDCFTLEAFKIILENAYNLIQDSKLYALCFLKQDLKGNISGNPFRKDYQKSTMFDLYFKEDVKGEKILVFNSKIRKKYKHELEGNEKFITEARMYHKMDNDYKILCINQAIEKGEYLEDGYTKNIQDTFYKYPKGYQKYFTEILQKGLKGVKIRKKIYVIFNWIKFFNWGRYFLIGDGSESKSTVPNQKVPSPIIYPRL